MGRKKQFKAESQRLLELMIHSIYTNKDIFLRELISNASDAQDKLYFKALEDGSMTLDRDALRIYVEADKDARTLTLSDSGIGMDEKELESFLGTIARSDSHAFKQALDDEDIDVIGQFGVGFYSAFMVSDSVEVTSRSFKEEQGYKFTSNGLDGYTIEPVEKESVGTTIVCHIKESTDEENYDDYLNAYTLRRLIKQYSDYIRYPIVLVSEADHDDEENNTKVGDRVEEVVNSMIPLWKRSKSEVTEEALNTFYKDKFHDYEDPEKRIQMKVEGNPSFDALLFIPKHAPANLYSNQFEPGLQLYSRGVFIMEHNTALIPDYFRFVRGLVDSPDLNLNISREILQHDRQLSQISSRIERKIKSELESMMANEREAYEALWNEFRLAIKYGVYDQFGANKDKLKDLLLFKTSNGGYTSLKEYIERMKEDQDVIYFVSGATEAKCASIPQAEYVKSKGFEVLYLVDEIDEFALQVLHEYEEKHFKSVTQGDLDLQDDAEEEILKEKTEETKDLMEKLTEALEGHVESVRLSKRLVNHPVCLVSDEGLSLEMERILSQMQDGETPMKAKRILEINPSHPVIDALSKVESQDEDKLKMYAKLLYDQACLIEGLPIDDTAEFSKALAQLMVDAA